MRSLKIKDSMKNADGTMSRAEEHRGGYGDPSPYIIDGKYAPIRKFPYQVSLRYNDKHYCGGSIINNCNILTAASCVAGFKDMLYTIKAHVGTNFLNESGDVYDIESVSIHKDYIMGDIRLYDIALVHLETPINYNELVQPINLTTSDENLDGKSCTLSEWDYTTNDEEVSNNLQEIDLSVYPQKKCEKLWGAKNTQICTLTRKGAGMCDGDYYDTGSPLVANGTQIGIISSFLVCEMGMGHPNVDTRVSSFLIWIMANLKN
ncbi:chymotrypsin-1-like [Temnothorax longispinosus]|uniref:chymotrypsin-1-like n=1 Tax=Temnothorax longispinosus TaxID=300112 RepID=UPI003A99D6BE